MSWIVVGFKSFRNLVIPLPFNWKRPIVSPRDKSSKVSWSSRGIASISKSIFSGYWQIYDPILRVEPYTNRIVSGKEMSYILILSSINGPNKIDCKFGDRLGEVSNKIIIGYGIVNDFREVTKRVFTVGQVPVFIAAN